MVTETYTSDKDDLAQGNTGEVTIASGTGIIRAIVVVVHPDEIAGAKARDAQIGDLNKSKEVDCD